LLSHRLSDIEETLVRIILYFYQLTYSVLLYITSYLLSVFLFRIDCLGSIGTFLVKTQVSEYLEVRVSGSIAGTPIVQFIHSEE